MTDTATTIGYKKWLVTCSDTPSEAIIKGKLTDLRQTETALHSRLQRLPCQQHTQRPEEGLPEDDRQSNHDYGSRILHNHGRVYHHADRYEEDSAEQDP